MEKIFPELVVEVQHAALEDEDGNKITTEVRYKGVKYVEMIPVLAQAIKEQQIIIEKQQRMIEALELRVDQLIRK